MAQVAVVWERMPTSARAIVAGLAIGLVGANVWSGVLLALGPTFLAAAVEICFLALYVAWARGHGPPRSTKPARARVFRTSALSARQWAWGVLAAVAFAATVHSALVILFRLVPFPAAAFHQGYDLGSAPSMAARWAVVLVSAASAGICEETGFRGYMQRPIEARHGPGIATLVSAVFFTLLHLNKSWLIAGLAPIVFGAGLLLGLIAWSSGSLVFCMLGHTLMDIGLFAYWWTQIAGVFSAHTIFHSGIDTPFLLACAVFAVALGLTLAAIRSLWRLRA